MSAGREHDDDLGPPLSDSGAPAPDVGLRSALAEVARAAAAEARPLLARAWRGARGRASELAQRTLGDDFEDRVHELRLHVERHGEDPFGLDPEAARQAVKICAFFHRLYFRTEVHGLQNLPSGKVLLVANHSGQIPIDAAIVGTALFLDVTPPRFMRAMVDRRTENLPLVSTFFSRIGQAEEYGCIAKAAYSGEPD